MNQMKNTKNKGFPTTRKDFINKMNKMCYYCHYNDNGYCTKHNGKTKEAIGICSKENKSYITYENKAYKMPNSLDEKNKNIKKQVIKKNYYKNLRQKQLIREQVKTCQTCSNCQCGWCVKTKRWCSNSMNVCDTLLTLKKNFKLQKRKRKKKIVLQRNYIKKAVCFYATYSFYISLSYFMMYCGKHSNA